MHTAHFVAARDHTLRMRNTHASAWTHKLLEGVSSSATQVRSWKGKALTVTLHCLLRTVWVFFPEIFCWFCWTGFSPIYLISPFLTPAVLSLFMSCSETLRVPSYIQNRCGPWQPHSIYLWLYQLVGKLKWYLAWLKQYLACLRMQNISISRLVHFCISWIFVLWMPAPPEQHPRANIINVSLMSHVSNLVGLLWERGGVIWYNSTFSLSSMSRGEHCML